MRFQPLQALGSLIALILAFLATASLGLALDLGADRQTVIQELGRPSSSVSHGSREFLSYPNRVRVELEHGRVVSAQGLVLGGGTDAPAAAPAPAATAPKAAPQEAKSAEPPAKREREAKGKPASLFGSDEEDDEAAEDDPVADAGIFAFGIGVLLVLVLIYFVVTCLALKIAFKIWEQDMFFKGYLAIAGIDLTLRVGLDKLGQYTHGMTSSWYLQQPITTMVMVFTIRHFSFNKDWGSAVQAAFTAKIAAFILFLVAMMSVVRLAMKFMS